MQQGLVAPERMAPLLESILRANGHLKMVSVRTLPVEPLSGIGARKDGPKHELLFRHAVELTVRGSYLDMVDYMTALESLPTQLFWGKAQLEVEEYPTVRLTLTLTTLSLDEKWMKL
jgi:MSHA biogenesis protein MshJ